MTALLPVVDLDPCSNPVSTVKARIGYSLEEGEDGLSQAWATLGVTTAFVNPPYSKVMPWVTAAINFAAEGGTTLMLVKADRTTGWFKASVAAGATPIYFLKRIKFEGAPTGANFPSAFLVFGDISFWWDFLVVLEQMGWIEL